MDILILYGGIPMIPPIYCLCFRMIVEVLEHLVILGMHSLIESIQLEVCMKISANNLAYLMAGTVLAGGRGGMFPRSGEMF